MKETKLNRFKNKWVEITFYGETMDGKLLHMTERGWLKRESRDPYLNVYKFDCGFLIKRGGEPIILKQYYILPGCITKIKNLRRIK